MADNPTNTNSLTTQQNAMIQALIKTLGIVTAASKKVGIDRSTHYDWYNTNEEYKKQVDEIKDIAIDFVEGAMFGAIKNGDAGLMKYYLSTQGKKRGYIEKTDIGFTDKNGDDVPGIVFYIPENGRPVEGQ